MFKVIKKNNKEGLKVETCYKELILDAQTFSKIKMSAEDTSKPFLWLGPLAVTCEESEALREINGRFGIRAIMQIDMKNDPSQVL